MIRLSKLFAYKMNESDMLDYILQTFDLDFRKIDYSVTETEKHVEFRYSLQE